MSKLKTHKDNAALRLLKEEIITLFLIGNILIPTPICIPRGSLTKQKNKKHGYIATIKLNPNPIPRNKKQKIMDEIQSLFHLMQRWIHLLLLRRYHVIKRNKIRNRKAFFALRAYQYSLILSLLAQNNKKVLTEEEKKNDTTNRLRIKASHEHRGKIYNRPYEITFFKNKMSTTLKPALQRVYNELCHVSHRPLPQAGEMNRFSCT